MLQYLWVLEAADVRVQVELDACACTGQRQSTDQKHQKHSKWESGCKVDNLQDTRRIQWGPWYQLLLVNSSILSKTGILELGLPFQLLCDLGPVAQPLWASAASPVTWL